MVQYPAEVDGSLNQQLTEQGLADVLKEDHPGLYQVLFEQEPGGNYVKRGIQEMPLPELAFLSKALQLDLTGIFTRIVTGQVSDEQINAFLKREATMGTALYQPSFPFKALHVADGVPAANKVIGAQLHFLK